MVQKLKGFPNSKNYTMSGLFEIRELLKEKQKRLAKVTSRLSLEQGGIKEKLNFKTRQLRKGKEGQLVNLKTELKGVEIKYDREEVALKQKLKNNEARLQWELDALEKQKEIIQKKYQSLDQVIEEKLEKLSERHTDLLHNYYHPRMNSLYESDEEVSEEDISLPLAYHKLKAEKEQLELSVASLTKTLKSAEENEEKQLMAAYEEKVKKERDALVKPKPQVIQLKRTIKIAKKADAVAPTPQELQAFRNDLETEWFQRKNRMRKCLEPLACKDDPFWLEGEKYLTPGEMQIFKESGGLFETVRQQMQCGIEDRQRAKELEEARLQQEAEDYRQRVLEREKEKNKNKPAPKVEPPK
jgi:hypothetical protein